MADGYANALQAGLVAALRADAGVSALVGARVYDEPPQDPTRPYVRLGDLVPRPIRTTGCKAARVRFSIEAHSRPDSGRVEAARIANAVVSALDENEAAVTVSGFTLVNIQWTATNTDRDADGSSYAAVAVFEAIIDG